jgi:uncharacterized membrane protein YgcG
MNDHPTPGTLPTAAVRRQVPKAEPRRPFHLGVAVGLCAGVYAGSLTAVTVLQIDRDRALIADRAPVGEAIELLGRHNDRMATAIEVTGAAFQHAAEGYDGVARGVLDLDTAVQRLTARVAAIKGSAMRIPDVIALPPVGHNSSSSGSKSSGGGGSSGSGSVSVPKPKPAPPPVQGSTGASGGG